MKQAYQLIICDSEAGYAEKLADYLRRSRECSFDIAVFTSGAAFLEREAEKEIELLLIEERIYQEFAKEGTLNQIYAKKVLVLAEDRKEQHDIGVQEETVYKYQAGSGILYHLLDNHADDKEKINMQMIQKHAEVIGVYSPVNRTLKTSFALTLGQIYAEKEETLYINLEGCSGLRELLSLQDEKNLADLVYEFSVKRNQFPVLLYQFVQKAEDLALISPVESIAELQCVASTEWTSLLAYIAENACYKKVILDVGENVNGIMDILQLCDIVYEPLRSDCVSLSKLSAFETAVKKYQGNHLSFPKFLKLEFPYFEDLGEGFMNLKYSSLGRYVRQLIDREEV